ncbi:hypothetical protein GE061_013672 [Apolygus lucorum]|uniref:Microtubule-associated protein 1B/S N-terminal domain-containing protein n=1 Tax=Apolygus lucorum TaxID=248454 RepID=A0A6A4K0T4_APOLU|nr:hypothetical protein GE061_013672 [Apolygus lucorum]
MDCIPTRPCMGDKSSGEGPPPPSPLTGAYLLIVLPQTHQLQHKDCVIHYLTKGLLTWDKTDCHVDLEKELQTITAQAPEGEEAKNGERLIQFASENLVTEVLIHPQLNTLVQCMRNLLSSFTRHRHIIHAGYTCAGNGAWMLQRRRANHEIAQLYRNPVTVIEAKRSEGLTYRGCSIPEHHAGVNKPEGWRHRGRRHLCWCDEMEDDLRRLVASCGEGQRRLETSCLNPDQGGTRPFMGCCSVE